MKQRKPYQSPVPPGEESQPLPVGRLHWQKFFFVCAGVILFVWGVAVVGDSAVQHRKGGAPQRADFKTQRVTIGADMLFFREEVALPAGGDGVAVMLVGPGERVAAAQGVATLCGDNDDAEALSQQTALEQRLRWLREASDAQHYHALNAEQLALQVDETFAGFLKVLAQGDCALLPAQQERFLRRATTLEAALGGAIDFSGEIAQTEDQIAGLARQAPVSRFTLIQAPAAGEYYPTADGLEGKLDPAALADMTPAEFTALRKLRPSQPDGLGKLVTGMRWYAAALINSGEAQQLREGGKYKVLFPRESAREFTMRVERVGRSDGGSSVVVLPCGDNDDAIQCLRAARAEIIMKTVEGLSVPRSALRVLEKGEGPQKRSYYGVYITRAGKSLVREVEVLYWGEKTAVVAWGNLAETQTLDGDRVTITGKIQSVTMPEDGQLLVIGQDLRLTAEYTGIEPVIPDGPTTSVTAQRALFAETIFSGKHLKQEQVDENTLVITGEGISYREQRGAGLKIYDSVLV